MNDDVTVSSDFEFTSGEVFQRGDRVRFTHKTDPSSNVDSTFVWAVMSHFQVKYVIGHDNGHPKSKFLATPPFADGFESIHSSYLKDDFTYMYADPECLTLLERNGILTQK